MGNRYRQENLAQCRQLLQMSPMEESDGEAPPDYRDQYEALTGLSLHECPVCRSGRMLTVEQITRPPARPLVFDTS